MSQCIVLLPAPRSWLYFRFYTFALLVYWTGLVQRLSLSLQLYIVFYRGIWLLKSQKSDFIWLNWFNPYHHNPNELVDSKRIPPTLCGTCPQTDHWFHLETPPSYGTINAARRPQWPGQDVPIMQRAVSKVGEWDVAWLTTKGGNVEDAPEGYSRQWHGAPSLCEGICQWPWDGWIYRMNL